MNTFINKVSKHCLRPMPDRMYTWLCLTNTGFFASAAATGSAGFALNDLPFPLNSPGNLGISFPNPATSVATSDPCGFKNLLQNSSTGTGLYTWCRIHKTIVYLTFLPMAPLDSVVFAIAPIQGNVQSYPTYVGAAQGPYSREKTAEAGVSQKENTIVMSWDMSKLFGIPNRLFSAEQGTAFTFAASPTATLQAYANVQWKTVGSVNLTQSLGWKIKIQYLCEFWGPNDVPLLDT